jgi:hypothetical protein
LAQEYHLRPWELAELDPDSVQLYTKAEPEAAGVSYKEWWLEGRRGRGQTESQARAGWARLCEDRDFRRKHDPTPADVREMLAEMVARVAGPVRNGVSK